MTTTLTEGPPTSERTTRTAGRHDPGRFDLIIDAALTLLLAVLALMGLGTVFGGQSYLVIGIAAALVGIGAAWLAAWRKLDPLLTILVLVGAFILFSGVASPDVAPGGFLPTPAALAASLGGLIHGWAGVVTTAPPVGVAAGLGVVPYVLGFSAGWGGMVLARRTTLALVPAVPALLVLLAVFALGTREPASLVWQGGAFALLVIGWGAVRANRSRRSVDGSVHWSRLGAAVAMLVMVVAIGLILGPTLPFVHGESRYNLREQVVPPFDPRDEPSPLGAFRSYLTKDAKDQTQFTVSGMPDKSLLRLATMDTFDGVVWVVGGPQAPSSGRFERVGTSILPVPPGQPAYVTIESKRDRDDVWVPTIGAIRSTSFEGPRSAQLAEAFRYNRSTQAGALPVRLATGDRLVLDVQLPVARNDEADRNRSTDASVQLPALPPIPEDVTKAAGALTTGASTPYEQALKLEQTFSQTGSFSDGGSDSKNTAAESNPGHSIARTQVFLEKGAKVGYVGDAEQYASTMAILARSLGLPARVAMGFKPPEGANGGAVDFHGADVYAWVEIAFEGLGWVAFEPTPPKDKRLQPKPDEQPKEVDLSQQVPPPPTYLRVPETVPDLGTRRPETAPPQSSSSAFEVPTALLVGLAVVSVPILIVAGVLGLVLWLKRRRARRRRRRGPPTRRLAAAWDETCDRARDLGAEVPGKVTRREAASVAEPVWPAVEPIARNIDATMFGPGPLEESAVDAVWHELDREHEATLKQMPRKARLRAALSLASLRPGRKRAKRRVGREAEDLLEGRGSDDLSGRPSAERVSEMV